MSSPRGRAVKLLATTTAFALVLVVAACGDDPMIAVAPSDGGGIGPAPDGGGADEDAGIATVAVSHTRELRGLWVSTVFRLDFPSSTALTETEAKGELEGIVAVAAEAGLNAIFFQVRAESDALYASALEPWSRFLTGTMGTMPAYDPLALLVEAAHAKGIEVHAWMNPYRALAASSTVAAPNHVTVTDPGSAITYGTAVVLDPSRPSVRTRVVAAVREVVLGYDVDGVVFDDYFYPYPIAGTPFPDDAEYAAYTGGGGALGKSDWRRDNVNQLVSAVAAAIRSEKSWVRFGVAPFGIYRPEMPPGVTGLDAYEELACDSLDWLDQGWVDYLSPQLYWTTTSAGQPFGALVDWWASKAKPGRPIVPSLGLHRLGATADWTASEYATQVSLTRAEGAGAAGNVHFRYAFLRDDASEVRAALAPLYAGPARPPVVPGAAGAVVAPPRIEGRQLSHPETGIRGYAVYREEAAGWVFSRWVPAGSASLTETEGRFSVSAIDRGGVESAAIVVDVTSP